MQLWWIAKQCTQVMTVDSCADMTPKTCNPHSCTDITPKTCNTHSCAQGWGCRFSLPMRHCLSRSYINCLQEVYTKRMHQGGSAHSSTTARSGLGWGHWRKARRWADMRRSSGNHQTRQVAAAVHSLGLICCIDDTPAARAHACGDGCDRPPLVRLLQVHVAALDAMLIHGRLKASHTQLIGHGCSALDSDRMPLTRVLGVRPVLGFVRESRGR